MREGTGATVVSYGRTLPLCAAAADQLNTESALTFVPHDEVYGLGIEDVLHREPSIDKIRAAIGWRPSLDLDRVLADVVDYKRRAPAAPVELQ